MTTVNPDAESDSGDDMPTGWQARTTIDGRIYYANHDQQSTQWDHPVTGKRMRLSQTDLPDGWQRIELDDKTVKFLNQSTGVSTRTDPRLAFAVEDVQMMFGAPPRQRHDASTSAAQVLNGVDLKEKTILITGANSGIGFETARSMAMAGAHVILACRNLTAAHAARDRILAVKPFASVDVLQLDLSSLLSVRRCALAYLARGWPLHILVLNAAVFACGYERSSNGLEMNFAVNHLGHYYLTKLLSELLVKSAPARVVVVSSESHKHLLHDVNAENISLELLSASQKDYWYIQAYGVSKLCNVLFAFSLNRRLISSKVAVNAIHPGNMISTSLPKRSCLMRTLFWLVRPFTKSIEQGASTTVFAACAPEIEGYGGQYFNNCWFCKPSDSSMDETLQTRLWEISESLIDSFERGQLGEPVVADGFANDH